MCITYTHTYIPHTYNISIIISIYLKNVKQYLSLWIAQRRQWAGLGCKVYLQNPNLGHFKL